jgi:hypothetical protein
VSDNEPKPCPFCGGPAKTLEYNGATQATCAAAYTECAGADVLAPVGMWNRRAVRKHDLVPGLLRAREIIATEERNDDPDLALGYGVLSRWAVDMFDFEIRKAEEAEGADSIDEATAAAITKEPE